MFLKIHGDIVEAKFLERLNRFTAKVLLDGGEQLAHVPTSGRLKELLLPHVDVYVRKCTPNPKRKTCLDLLQVKSQEGVWVSLDSILPNVFMEHLLKGNHLPEYENLKSIAREIKYKNSRFDFATVDQYGNQGFIEVKSVTLVENNIAKFPDAPSSRGAKHLTELIEAVKEGYQGSVVFVVQRNDATAFTPNKERDLEFTDNLILANESGVKVYCYTCVMTKTGIELDKKIPVLL